MSQPARAALLSLHVNTPEGETHATFPVCCQSSQKASRTEFQCVHRAGARGIESACLLATIPQYAISLPNPRGSRALVQTLGGLLGVKPDVSEFDASVRQMDNVMAQIEERLPPLPRS